MPNKKNLNGIPGNIADQYFSTMNYFDGGYMPCWLYYIANKQKITEIEIDILKDEIYPKEAKIKPLLFPLYKLRRIIQTQLKNSGFEEKFITNAKLKFEINLNSKLVYCNPYIEDVEGNIYTCKKTIYESVYPINNLFKGNYDSKNYKSGRGILYNWIKNLFK